MGAISMSVRVDAGVIGHNNRNFVAKNVNAEKVSDNITYVQKDLKEAYTEIFSEALEKYNAKQNRSDRVIKDYLEHIKNGNQEKPFYEAIIQFGDMKNSKVGTEGGELAKKMLDEYMKDFEKRNPNFTVFNAVMHLDESTPHLHIDFIPVAYNQSRGLETRVSLRKACEQMDCSSKSKKHSERQQWAEKEKEIMKSIAKKHGLEIENKNIKRPHLSVEEYKQTCRELDKKKKQINELYEKSNLNPSEMKKSDLDLLVNHSKQLQKEVEEKNQRLTDLQNRIQSDFRYIKIGEEQKINFIADNLRKEGISVVDDIDGTVTVIFAGTKNPKKYNPAKSYSINNDWHINELATQINFINREHINSAAELEGMIEKSGKNILEQQNALKGYFSVQRHILNEQLTPVQLRTYLFICRSLSPSLGRCWNSYNDLAKLLGTSRSKAIELVAQLTNKNVIRKQKIKTRSNRRVYGDNHYTVVCYVPHQRIRRRAQGKKTGLLSFKSSPVGQSANLSIHNILSNFNNITEKAVCQVGDIFFTPFLGKVRRKKKYIHNNITISKLRSQLSWHEMYKISARKVKKFFSGGSPQN